ncbi:MAG: phosphoenolpyruvate carboxykinase (GTP) [Oscillospiraceae bacterium]|nr:phosphoenolpyruvate carboxykinase (GTP) [Oscillospiraceae bacterium]
MVTNPNVLNRVEEIANLANPEKVLWVDGSEGQIEEIRQLAINAGVIKQLDEDEYPGCVFHRTLINDAARVERRTFVCTDEPEQAGNANNWLDPDEIKLKLKEMFDKVMAGRTMYVIPFILGVPGSPLVKAGIEITDSVYVALNMVVLARCGEVATDLLNQAGKDFLFGLHSFGNAASRSKGRGEENQYICYFPQENSVWAVNTGFGVNAFLSKKAISLRMASYLAKNEGWLAENMAILEVETPDGEITYIAAAFPSGCGKTSLAMLEVSPIYAEKGYKVRCVSEDVAWLKKGEDGRLWAFNPETGVFGFAPGVNAENSPNVYSMTRKDAIFTNVVYLPEENTVWWEGLSDEEIINAVDWKGELFNYTPSDKSDGEIAEAVEREEGFDEPEEFGEFGDFAKYEEYEEGYDEHVSEREETDSESDEDKSEETGESNEMGIPFDFDEGVLPEEPVPVQKLPRVAKVIPVKGAHPNSRFTVALSECPNLSSEYSNPNGVPISAIVFGGRRSKTVPLVYQAFDWEHGVFVGTILGTEPLGYVGSGFPPVRREPMAMLAFCGYNMADYFSHWLKMGKKLGRNAPKIFNVNWFKIGEGGKPIWPGFGENIRVLDWIIRRVKSSSGAQKCPIVETPVGYSPKIEDIDIEGLDLKPEMLKNLLHVDKYQLKEDVNSIKQFYAGFGDRLPEKLKEQLIELEKRLMNV